MKQNHYKCVISNHTLRFNGNNNLPTKTNKIIIDDNKYKI